MAISLETSNPLSFYDWTELYNTSSFQPNHEAYLEYLKSWYTTKQFRSSKKTTELKQNYIQLIQDLSYFFTTEEKETLLQGLDYNNDADLVKVIPYFARKLKEISLALCSKRESLKDTKLKYNLISSNLGVEKLLYDYILKSFTQKSGSYIKVSTSDLKESLPELDDIKDHFYIEIEELYDVENYFDSDPSVSVSEYHNIQTLLEKNPNLNQNEIEHLLATRLFPRVALNNNSSYYKKILESTNETNVSENVLKIENLASLNKKYLGETVYTLSAEEIFNEKVPLKLNFQPGNNWFYWPSGEKILDTGLYDNVYDTIFINESNFLKSGATAGTKPSNSDLIYIEKNGTVEGAWLNSDKEREDVANVKVFLEAQKINEFIFPYVGYKLDPKTLQWKEHTFSNLENYYRYDLLNPSLKTKIQQQYYFETLPLSSSLPLYLNNTNLKNLSNQSSKFSDEADVIIKRENLKSRIDVYHDYSKLPTEEAFLYKPDKTDLPLKEGINNVYWPFIVYNESYNIPIILSPETCEPINLGSIIPNYPMSGAISGYTYATSDVIFKYEGRSGEVIEAAWLGAPSVTSLDVNYQSNIPPVYSVSASRPAAKLDGPIQCALALLVPPGEKHSFIWCDIDTYADEVFTYKPHSIDCEYLKGFPHNYSKDIGRSNPSGDLNSSHWKKCTCKSTIYSPIGHGGRLITDYNGTADYLFADPEGLGSHFLLNNWLDTRGLNVFESPQFSYFRLNPGQSKLSDNSIGWGPGLWQTGNGAKMVLKTGQRYTYYRSTLNVPVRETTDQRKPPYFVINYPYKDIPLTGIPGNPVDLCVIIDSSGSQLTNLNFSKELSQNLINDLLPLISQTGERLFQISLVNFDYDSNLPQILVSAEDKDSLISQLNDIQVRKTYPQYTTNINKGLKTSYDILTTTSDYTLAGVKKTNRPNQNPLTKKRILIITDGVENQDIGQSIITAENIKSKNIEILVVSLATGQEAAESVNNRLLYKLSTDVNYYFDYNEYANASDPQKTDYLSFYRKIKNQLLAGTAGIEPPKPIGWRKAVKDQLGIWTGVEEPSNMILRPGDFLGYLHKASCEYAASNNSSFTQNSISFSVNVQLRDSAGNPGASPFWAKMYNDPQSVNIIKDNRFNKETNAFGGHLRFYDDYVPIHQPEVSDLILNNGDFIQYNLKGIQDLIWEEPVLVKTVEPQNKWKKLIFYKNVSNLKDLPLKNGDIDKIGYGSDEDSLIPLQEFSLYKKTQYNYYARNPFILEQDLIKINNCSDRRLLVTTAIAISPDQPYCNLTNKFYPTVASVNYPEFLISEKEIGFYLTPEKLGVSTYRGRGYNNIINESGINLVNQKKAEMLFLHPTKYTTNSRGLTQKDQYSPTEVLDVDSSWMFESLNKNKMAGVYRNTARNQKLVPYQSNYEILNKNILGLNRQEEKLLVINEGELTSWKVDEFGNDYALYKETEDDLIQGENLDPIIISQPQSLSVLYNSSTSLKVQASAVDDGPLFYYWYKNNSLVYTGNSALPLENVQSQDTGNYQVIVRSLDGRSFSDVVQVSVKTLPDIYFTSPDVIRVVGSDVTLTVRASGYGNLIYEWHKENTGTVNNGSSSIYALDDVLKNDSGVYYCVVSNEIGSVTSRYINVDIGYAPGLTSPLETYRSVLRGSNVLLNLALSGDEPMDVKWYNYGSSLIGNVLYNYQFEVNEYNAILTNKYGRYNTNSVVISSYVTAPLPENGLVTEDGSYLVDENGNYIIWM